MAPAQSHLHFEFSQGLEFLKDDNEFSKRVLETELEASKRVVKTIEALIVVGAFIAGVQAQVIACTSGTNDTTLQVVTNGFGFTGLVLDVLGTCFGIFHAIKLNKSIQEVPNLLHARSKELLDDMIKLPQGPGVNCGTDVDRVVKRLETEISARNKFWMLRRHLFNVVETPLHDHLKLLFDHNNKSLEETALWQVSGLLTAAGVEPHAATIGTDPALAIGGGIACLLASVLSFAIYSQHKWVWRGCVIITVITASSMMCGIWFHDRIGRGARISHHPIIHVDANGAAETLHSLRC